MLDSAIQTKGSVLFEKSQGIQDIHLELEAMTQEENDSCNLL